MVCCQRSRSPYNSNSIYHCQVYRGVDVLKLFARLKEISAKLPGVTKPEGEDPPTGTPDPRLIELPPIAPINRPGLKKWDRSSASTTPSNLGSPHPPKPTASTLKSAENVTPDLDPEPNLDSVNPSTTTSAKSTKHKAKTPISGAVGTTIAAVGATMGWIGAVAARPFHSSQPLHKKSGFWAVSGLALTTLLLGGAWLFVDSSVSQYQAEDALNYVRPGTISIKGVDGTMLLQTGNATRETLKSWQMPTRLKQAFVAIEDSRFYQHDGVDYKGVARAMVSNLTSKSLVEGASSINQQLARMVYLNQERSFWRKLREFRIAQRLGQELTKDQILERYLNLVYLGEGTYGVADSAWVYFSKTVDQLTLAEMATLAAMPPAPNKYSPFVNPQFAKQRRNFVLDRMVDDKFITVAEATVAKSEPLRPKRSGIKRELQQARYFTKYIEQELPQRISAQAIKEGGLTIETTLNPEWQTKAEAVVNATVKNNRRSFGQAAMVSIDPRTGGIRAMVGGTDFSTYQFNRVTQAKRQPGSTFKPIVYATAIAGGLSPNRSYLDAPFDVDGYKPKNASKKFKGQISMRDALVNSVNIVAIKVLIDTGWKPVIDVAHKMGIESRLEPYYSLALGGLEVNLLEITSAYTTFAHEGVHNPAHGITRVIDRKGEVLYQHQPQPVRVLEPDTTAIMTWMMRGVVNEGTATSAQIGRPVAGKTGTTDKERDLWFIGFVPQLVTGVWLGNDNNNPTGNASSTAAYAWSRFMTTAVKTIPSQDFLPRPGNVNRRKPELQLDPIHPRYQRTLPLPKDGEKTDQERSAERRGDPHEDRPRRSRRRRQAGSEDTPRRSQREDASNNGSETTTPRRSRREEASNNGSETTPRRSRRNRQSHSASEE
jgi:penicillin-binding protein 1A